MSTANVSTAGVLLAAAVAACGGPTPRTGGAREEAPAASVAEARLAIEAANDRATDALLRGDAAGVVARYADDAVVMLAGQPAWRGRSEAQQRTGEWLARATYTAATFVIDDVHVGGDLAIATGSGSVTYAPRGAGPVTVPVKHLTVWRRQPDGSLRIIRDIGTTDTCAPCGRVRTASGGSVPCCTALYAP